MDLVVCVFVVVVRTGVLFLTEETVPRLGETRVVVPLGRTTVPVLRPDVPLVPVPIRVPDGVTLVPVDRDGVTLVHVVVLDGRTLLTRPPLYPSRYLTLGLLTGRPAHPPP